MHRVCRITCGFRQGDQAKLAVIKKFEQARQHDGLEAADMEKHDVLDIAAVEKFGVGDALLQ